MLKETSSIQKVSIQILKSGSQDLKLSAKSGKSNTPKRKSVSWRIRSKKQKLKLPMLLQLQLKKKHQLLSSNI